MGRKLNAKKLYTRPQYKRPFSITRCELQVTERITLTLVAQSKLRPIQSINNKFFLKILGVSKI